MLDTITVLLGLFATLAECKYCWHTTSYGKSTHFYCGAFEYCCGDKCCENFNEFYKMWYFWVFVLVLLVSGCVALYLCFRVFVLVLLVSGCVALYWLRRRYVLSQLFPSTSTQDPSQRHRPGRRRRNRRYRQLSGETNGATVAPVVIIPDNVVTAPPPYSGDNGGCHHSGPPPYSLGSGSSINSQTLPRNPPSYQEISKEPPPVYCEYEVVVVTQGDSKKGSDNSSNDPS